MKKKKLIPAISLLLLSAVLITTASFAWFSMNTSVKVSGFRLEAYSDSLYLEISENENGPFSKELDFSERAEASRRLVTLGQMTGGGMTINAEQITDGSHYSSAVAEGIHYYQKVVTDPTRNDSFEGDNYICIDSKLHDASSVAGYYNLTNSQIAFSVVTDTTAVYNGTGDYYNKIGNTYRKLSPDTDGTVTENEIAVGTRLRGYYTVTLGTPEGENSHYDGSSRYYSIDANGNISPVGTLTLGTPLNGYYTVTETETEVEKADGTSKYYIKNGRGDYVCVGTPEQNTDLRDYYYWGRAYSTKAEEVQETNTMSVLKQEGLENYYLHDTLYLRMASTDRSGDNLRVGAVSVVGEDSLTKAVRVLIVAENGAGEIARATYNNRTGVITHTNSGKLFDTILGQAREIVKVEIYIYFDGTDPSAKSQDVYLAGQSVSVQFNVDYPDYVL